MSTLGFNRKSEISGALMGGEVFPCRVSGCRTSAVGGQSWLGRNSWERQQHDMSEELRSVQAAGDSRTGYMVKVRAGNYVDLAHT